MVVYRLGLAESSRGQCAKKVCPFILPLRYQKDIGMTDASPVHIPGSFGSGTPAEYGWFGCGSHVSCFTRLLKEASRLQAFEQRSETCAATRERSLNLRIVVSDGLDEFIPPQEYLHAGCTPPGDTPCSSLAVQSTTGLGEVFTIAPTLLSFAGSNGVLGRVSRLRRSGSSIPAYSNSSS